MNTYMSTMSKLLLALCFALFTSVTLMGCGGNDPNVDVQALAEGIGHGDTAAMKDFKQWTVPRRSWGTNSKN